MSRGTILFLEDDPHLQSLVSASLSERGYEVEPARTVKEARTVLACIRVDAAIVDGLLPGVREADFLQELRQKHPALPILLASAFSYTPQELLLRVEQMLAVKPPPRPPVAQAEAQDSSDDLDATFRALSAGYAARLAEKLRELAAALERARAGSAEALDEAYQLAHKLHGTAGSYGLHAVSGAAWHLESLLRQARDGKATADWRALEAAWQALQKTGD